MTLLVLLLLSICGLAWLIGLVGGNAQPAEGPKLVNPNPLVAIAADEAERPAVAVVSAEIAAEKKPGPRIDPLPEPVVVAPVPRPALGFLPPRPGYTSDWKRVGEVEVRIAGIALGPVPLELSPGRVIESRDSYLAVWLEVRTVEAGRKIELRRWQTWTEDCQLLDTIKRPIGWMSFGSGVKLGTGLPYTQTVVPGERPTADVLAFEIPPPGKGDLLLLLNAERVGEVGRYSFPIPRAALRE